MKARLFRLMDPFEAGAGFFTPLFALPGTNTPCVQVAGGGRVQAFEPYTRESYPGVDIAERSVAVGEPLVWSFVFAPDDVIVGQGADDHALLADRLGEPFFEQRLLQGIEAAEFVGNTTARVRFATRVHRQLAERSATTAGAWRDLSMLTPDVVTALRTLPADLLSRAVRDMRRVIAVGDEDGLTVHGVEENAPPHVIGAITERVAQAFAGVRGLYPEIGRRPPISFRETPPTRVPPPPRTPVRPIDAVIRVLDTRLEALLYALNTPCPSRFTIQAYDRLAPRSVLEEHKPRGVFSIARLDCPVQGLPIGDIHLALRPNRAWTQRDHDLAGGLPPNSLVIDTPAMMDRRFGDGAEGVVRNAVAAVTSIRERRDGLGDGDYAIYMQATGTGPRPELDAWCQLHARVTRLGLEGVGGTRFYTAGGHEPSDLHPIGAALFPQVDLVDVEMGSEKRRRAACGIILETSASPPRERNDHMKRAAKAVLIHRGWRVRSIGDSQDHRQTLSVQGDIGSFDCDTRSDEPPAQLGGVAREGRRASDGEVWFSRVHPLNAERVRVYEEADVSAIVGELMTNRTLLVILRDLALSNPSLPPMVSLLSGQVRRFSNGLPSKARTHYLSMLVFAAFSQGAVRLGNAPELEQLLMSGEIGERFDLTCHSIGYGEDYTVATVRVVEPVRSRHEKDIRLHFKLMFAPTGLLLLDGDAAPDDYWSLV